MISAFAKSLTNAAVSLHQRRWPLWSAVVLSFCVLLAGCYGSTRPVIKIGLVASFEELYREEGYAALYAVKLAIAQRNAQGGVGGRQVALVALNDNGRPEEAALQARKLGLDRDVVGVIGPLLEATVAGAADELATQRLPWIAPVPFERRTDGGWSLSASPFAIGHTAVGELIRLGAVERITVFTDQPSALAGAQSAADSLGLLWQALSLAASPADVSVGSGLVWLGDAERGAALLNGLQSDSAVLVGGPEAGSPVFVRRAAPHAASAWLSSGPPTRALPPEFSVAYQQLAGAPPGPQAVLAYDATTLLLDALAFADQEYDSLARPAVRQALHELVTRGWTGVSGRFVWDDNRCAYQARCDGWSEAPLYVQRGP